MKNTTAIVAHRGASHDAPENTLAAFREAWAQGADNVECDLRISKDGAVIVLHDETLLRTAGISKRPQELDFDELRQLDAGSWKGPEWCGERISALRDLLQITPPGKRWTLEIKGGMAMVPMLARELQHAVGCGWVGWQQLDVISFDYAALLYLRHFNNLHLPRA